jgi:hypothetical protein
MTIIPVDLAIGQATSTHNSVNKTNNSLQDSVAPRAAVVVGFVCLMFGLLMRAKLFMFVGILLLVSPTVVCIPNKVENGKVYKQVGEKSIRERVVSLPELK